MYQLGEEQLLIIPKKVVLMFWRKINEFIRCFHQSQIPHLLFFYNSWHVFFFNWQTVKKLFWSDKKFVFFFNCSNWEKFVDKISETNWGKYLLNLWKDGKILYEGDESEISAGKIRVEFIKSYRDNPKVNAIIVGKGSLSGMYDFLKLHVIFH